jgi:hypothetical protein
VDWSGQKEGCAILVDEDHQVSGRGDCQDLTFSSLHGRGVDPRLRFLILGSSSGERTESERRDSRLLRLWPRLWPLF